MADKKNSKDGEDMAIDKIVHEPARLKIMAYLNLLEQADFVFLLSRTGLTWGNLSSHMSKLEEAGYIEVQKKIKDKRSHTMLALTEQGRAAYSDYRTKMLDLLGAS